MARPTLQSGDVWSDSLSNAAGFPRLDGKDEYGSGPKAIDDWLSDAPDQIKAKFYGWLNRVQVQPATGLSVSYTGASILKRDGTVISLTAGAITLPPDSTVYLFINESGAVTQAPALPAYCIPLAIATTDGISITSLIDIRYQALEVVTSASDGASSSFQISDIKTSASAIADPGWFLCDNGLYNDGDYPIAATKIGRQYSRPGDALGTFRTPLVVDKVVVGAGSKYSLGQSGGAESVALNAATGFKHTHSMDDSGHNHGASDSGHSHSTDEDAHGHPIYASFSRSGGNTDSLIVENTAAAGEQNGPFGYTTETNNNSGPKIILPQKTNLKVRSAKASVSVALAQTGITAKPAGDSQPHENMMPFIALNSYIRLY